MKNILLRLGSLILASAVTTGLWSQGAKQVKLVNFELQSSALVNEDR